MWHLVPDRALLPGHRHKMYSDMLYNRTYKVPWHPCNVLSPPRRAPWNSTSWTLCDTSRGQNIPSQISVDQRGISLQHIPGTCTPSIFICAQMLWFCPCYMSPLRSLLHVAWVCTTKVFLSLQDFPATWPLVSGHLFLFFAVSATMLFFLIHRYYQNRLSYGHCAHDALQFDINPVTLSNQKKKFNFCYK